MVVYGAIYNNMEPLFDAKLHKMFGREIRQWFSDVLAVCVHVGYIVYIQISQLMVIIEGEGV
jgi:hypothetical protein